MKKILCLSFLILLLSGCSIVYIDRQTIDEIIDTILVDNVNLKNVSHRGYSYYLPQGVSLNNTNNDNSILYYNHKKMYLYVDLISYYHHIDYKYEKLNNVYYQKSINKNGYKGYLVITDINDKYFIEFMYKYSKIEAYVNKNDVNKTITQMAYILNSISFNDSVIESLVGENALNYREEQFDIFKPNGEESNFLDFVEQYDDGRSESKDEDILDLETDME